MTGSISLSRSSPGTTVAVAVAIAVAALGYFVDVFDILLFSVVRVVSLRDLGVPAGEQLGTGLTLLSIQNAGLPIGGILFGINGDRAGRRSVLFGSILLYSVANLVNAGIHSVPAYATCRFVAGLGLAGELGAGVTLVSELMPTRLRGYGTSIIASVGLAGGLAAPWVGTSLPWRTAFVVGGVAGLVLLLLRLAVHESPLFRAVEKSAVPRGNLLLLLRSRDRVWRYVRAFLTGLPIWYAIGILVSLAPEIGKGLGVSAPVVVAPALFNMYIGLMVGDMSAGLLSQALRSRRWVMLLYLVILGVTIITLLRSTGLSPHGFYWLCFPLGLGAGYWVLFVTAAAEQFGTNLRATVATSLSNLVRGAIIPIAALFHFLAPSLGIRGSADVVGAVCVGVAIAAVLVTPETFDRDLDYLET